MDMGILNAGCSDNLHLLGEGLFEFALEERGHFPKLKVNNILLQSLRIPQCKTNALAINFRLQIMGFEVTGLGVLWSEYVICEFSWAIGSLLWWEC